MSPIITSFSGGSSSSTLFLLWGKEAKTGKNFCILWAEIPYKKTIWRREMKENGAVRKTKHL